MDIHNPIVILIPLPNYGFDPTEVSIPWTYLTAAKFKIIFATPDGQPAQCDIRMLTGKDFGILKPFLINDKNGQMAYQQLEQANEFQQPISYQIFLRGLRTTKKGFFETIYIFLSNLA